MRLASLALLFIRRFWESAETAVWTQNTSRGGQACIDVDGGPGSTPPRHAAVGQSLNGEVGGDSPSLVCCAVIKITEMLCGDARSQSPLSSFPC